MRADRNRTTIEGFTDEVRQRLLRDGTIRELHKGYVGSPDVLPIMNVVLYLFV